ncbi:POT family protein [Colletotrichum orchidophilum]|uniref:POT family protein n=1 Tax=Colletotrichum orchidophilum TaxID=1209926 RepID=A0A1G4AU74_9PEZI|nr:POT family protein [Colletotrichum orchidophilum]OHE92646.1 POT family protein [Colletotrichum orchidophilum]
MPAGDTIDKSLSEAQLRDGSYDMKYYEDVSLDEKRGIKPRPDAPTDEELQTLRRVSDHIPFKLFTIAFVELCERFSYYGSVIVVSRLDACTVQKRLTVEVLVTNFIQQPLPGGSTTGAAPNGQPGALGMGQQASTGITTFNQFWQYFMPLFGAWVADKYWGRYKTICISIAVDLVGHLILITAAIPPVITKPSGNSLSALLIGMITIGFATGGFKPNVSPLIAEQLELDHLIVRTLPTGEKVVVDPAITINRVYNWFYMFINVGALVGQISMVYAEKYVGFWLSFTLPTCMLALCPLVMWWGKGRYRDTPPTGSVLGPALRTFVFAQRGRWSINPVKTWRNMHDGTFWERVKPSNFSDATRPKWMTFDDAWVEELRRGFAACAVFSWYPIYWLSYNQLNNNLVSQAATMQLNGLPNDILSNLDPIALILFIPLCDLVLYPTLRKLRIPFTPIKKIAFGFFTGSMAMVWACVLQYYIYQRSACGQFASGTLPNGEACPPVDILVWAQTGAYVLIALSEIFASITSLEYAFSKAPKNMRSMVQAVALFMSAISAALGQAFTPLSTDPYLVWNYGIVAVLAAVAGVLFWFQFRDLDKEEDAMNELPEGRVGLGAAAETSRMDNNGKGN